MTLSRNLTVSITAAVALRPSTIYCVKVDDIRNGQSWCVRRCFSEFYALRCLILKTLRELEYVGDVQKSHPLLFNGFPKRLIFGSRRNSVVQHRVVALQDYLRVALVSLSHEHIVETTSVFRTLVDGISEFIGYRISKTENESTEIQLDKNWLPLEPNRRCLAGKSFSTFIHDSGSTERIVRSNSCPIKIYDNVDNSLSKWSMAGDAVGLWAASNSVSTTMNLSENITSPASFSRSRNYTSQSTHTFIDATPQSPMVYRELIVA